LPQFVSPETFDDAPAPENSLAPAGGGEARESLDDSEWIETNWIVSILGFSFM